MTNEIKQPTIEDVKRLKEDAKLIDMFAQYIIEKVKLEMLAPTIENVYNTILKKYDFVTKERRGSKKITDYDKLYQSDQCTKEFYKEVNQALHDQGHMEGTNDGCCPKLVQESIVRELRIDICEIICKQLFDIDIKKNYVSCKIQDKMFDLTYRLLA